MAVIFDFGGTLDADGTRWSLRFHAAYRKAGGRLGPERFEPLFRESDRLLASLPGVRQAGFRATLEAQSVLLSRLLAQGAEAVAPDTLAAPVHAAAVAVAARNRTLLARLAGDHRLGVVSNYSGNLEVCLEELDLLQLFDVVIDSANVGVRKPDPRIFRLALEPLAAEPAVTWMVGDNPDTDLVPAAALGLRTCWLAPPEDRRAPPPGIPSARIASLSELAGVLDVPCTV